jgi:hypothetical protein
MAVHYLPQSKRLRVSISNALALKIKARRPEIYDLSVPGFCHLRGHSSALLMLEAASADLVSPSA